MAAPFSSFDCASHGPHRRAREQHQQPIRHHRFARAPRPSRSPSSRSIAAPGSPARLSTVWFGLHHVNKRPALAGLNGLGRDHAWRSQCVSSVSATVTNCPGHSSRSWFSNAAFRWMVPVVASTVLSITERVPLGRVRCASPSTSARTGELTPRAQPPHVGQALLGNAEIHENRLDPVNHHQRHVVHLHQVAGMHQQVAGPPSDRRADLAVSQIELRGCDCGFVGLQRGLGRVDARLRGAHRLAGDIGGGFRLVQLRTRSQSFFHQLIVPRGVRIRVLSLAESRPSVASDCAICARSRAASA